MTEEKAYGMTKIMMSRPPKRIIKVGIMSLKKLHIGAMSEGGI